MVKLLDDNLKHLAGVIKRETGMTWMQFREPVRQADWAPDYLCLRERSFGAV